MVGPGGLRFYAGSSAVGKLLYSYHLKETYTGNLAHHRLACLRFSAIPDLSLVKIHFHIKPRLGTRGYRELN